MVRQQQEEDDVERLCNQANFNIYNWDSSHHQLEFFSTFVTQKPSYVNRWSKSREGAVLETSKAAAGLCTHLA